MEKPTCRFLGGIAEKLPIHLERSSLDMTTKMWSVNRFFVLAMVV